jgi:polyisoprenoid-binding protein YceI
MSDHIEQSDGGDAAPPERPRRSKLMRRLPLGVFAIAVAGIGLLVWHQASGVISSRKYRHISYTVPVAPKLTAAKGETVYRIDPTHSSLSYSIQEHFTGRSGDSTATGVTNGMSGDIAIDPQHGADARLGTIVANVEQFHSDNNLRDARLRQDFLQSHEHPLAKFKVTSLKGLPGPVVSGKTYRFEMEGTATVRGVTAPLDWSGTASLDRAGLHATAVAKTKLSNFGVGPISLSGLVKSKDDVRLTLQITALDPTKHTIPTQIDGPDAKPKTGGPSFEKTIMPILESSCASCHNKGQVGAEHWELDTAKDASIVADGIETVTQTGYMPPWPASHVGVPLKDELSLTKKQISDLAAWARADGRLDVPGSTPIRPNKKVAEQTPRQDQRLFVPTYTGSLGKSNDYRCFVLQPKITKTSYLTGYQFLPDQIPELHHAQVFHISPEQVQEAKQISGKDGKPGWQCYGTANLRGRGPQEIPGRQFHRDVGFAGQSHLVAGWVPGQLPVIYPEHAGVLLNPGDALVLQIHYHYDDIVTPDHSGLALQIDPYSPKIKAVRVVNPLGPVEIPCAPGAKEKLCDRDASVKRTQELYGTNDEAGLLALCGKTPEMMTKGFDGVHASSSCNLVVPEDGTIIGVFGHEHTLGSTFRMTLDAGTAKQKVLLDIPDWDFDWQMNYSLEKPIHVTAGEPLKLDCSWDRSIDPNRAQRYITFAEDTESEMCFGTYALIPDDQ